MAVTLVSSISDIRNFTRITKSQGQRLALVPTMGALHEGHASLIRQARSLADAVTVSIFVNPTQFGPKEDFAQYPRTLDADQAVCEEAGATIIFAPTASEMYPTGFSTFVEVPGLEQSLCGPSRPGHFRGVCTVVMKLLQIVQPDLAIFGAKDAQQAMILQRMVSDLAVPVEMVIAPIVREADGLAMSSRNRYLTPAERAVAPMIYQSLKMIEQRALVGEWDVARLESVLHAALAEIPGCRVDYAQIVDAVSLQSVARLDRPVLVAVAVFLGKTRLIDNVIVKN